MRFFPFFVLLVASVLLANGDALEKTTEANTISSYQLLVPTPFSAKYETHATRFLRANDDEERVLPILAPSVSLFTNWVKAMGLKVTDSVRARYWLWRKQSIEGLFKQLKLDGGLNKILANPKFNTWATYVNLYNKKNPGKEVTMAGILTNTYGDLALSRMLEVALNVGNQRKMAAVLAQQQRQGWQSAGKSADDVFGTTMIKTFTKFFGDEALAKTLEAARHVPNTEKVATQFQTAQFTQWLRDGKKHEVIWKMLNMEKATWMKNPDAQVWYRYKDFYKANIHKVTGQ
ncbi:hypothetical protein PC117_g6066 [Phytophthora cactorum]|uniref:RxLR effector protein n=1 Tax=Phytophthora cactorum TaxID=29920 RepID=A0A8T1E5S4_9STRA|nr:hypothetical protein PC117_g6066 [Phytophthora cactorum]